MRLPKERFVPELFRYGACGAHGAQVDCSVSPAAGVVDGSSRGAAGLAGVRVSFEDLLSGFFGDLLESARETAAEETPEDFPFVDLAVFFDDRALCDAVSHLADEGGLFATAGAAVGAGFGRHGHAAVRAGGRVFGDLFGAGVDDGEHLVDEVCESGSCPEVEVVALPCLV